MSKKHRPKRGSLQFWPRKRAKRSYAKIRSWSSLDGTNLLAFIGYKAGMTHIMAKDNTPTTLYKKDTLSIPVTIIECPPLKPLSLRFYQNSYQGTKVISEVYSKRLDKEVKKTLKLPKKEHKIPENFDDVKLVVYTQPKLTSIGKKKPDILEIAISGKDPKEKLEFANKLMENEIKISNIFQNQKLLDIHSVTKGKGFQGTVKRFGVTIRQHKSEKTKRGIGNLGAWTPKKVLFSVPHAGKMGYHLRTQYNSLNIKIDSDPKKVNPKSGFLHYGPIKNDYIILKGSIPGPAKRTIIMTTSIRQKQSRTDLEIKSINLDSKQ